jgi:hypothetical protein
MEDRAAISGMMVRLRECQPPATREKFGASLLRWIEDPLKPRTANGAVRINPILILLAVLVAFAVGTFVVFSLTRL